MSFTKEQIRSVQGKFGLSLDLHPAKARHPLRRDEVLLDDDGDYVPLIKDQCCVRLDGVMIGYVVLDTLKILLTRPVSQLSQPIVDAVEEMVQQLGDVQSMNVIAEPRTIETEDDDE
jgi:hypothetical protein